MGGQGGGAQQAAHRLALTLARWYTTPRPRPKSAAETFPFFGNANRLLLASHGRLMYYRYDTDELRVLHEGQVRRRRCCGTFPVWQVPHA